MILILMWMSCDFVRKWEVKSIFMCFDDSQDGWRTARNLYETVFEHAAKKLLVP